MSKYILSSFCSHSLKSCRDQDISVSQTIAVNTLIREVWGTYRGGRFASIWGTEPPLLVAQSIHIRHWRRRKIVAEIYICYSTQNIYIGSSVNSLFYCLSFIGMTGFELASAIHQTQVFRLPLAFYSAIMAHYPKWKTMSLCIPWKNCRGSSRRGNSILTPARGNWAQPWMRIIAIFL